MNARIEELEKRLESKHHKDLFLQMKHTLQAVDDLAEEHRRYQAVQALSGVRIVGSEESVYFDTLNQVKELIVHTLEIRSRTWSTREISGTRSTSRMASSDLLKMAGSFPVRQAFKRTVP